MYTRSATDWLMYKVAFKKMSPSEQLNYDANTTWSIVLYAVLLDMKGCICYFSKWQIYPFISALYTLLYPLYIPFHIRFIYRFISVIYTLSYPSYIPFHIRHIYPFISALYTLLYPLYIPFHIRHIYPFISALYTLLYPLYIPFHGWDYKSERSLIPLKR